jgi:phage FluMu protein Com
MEEIICKNCGSIDDYITKSNGPHTEARCNGCGKHIKFISKDSEPTLYFGKYCKWKVKNITDKNYLEWLLENHDSLKNPIREAIKTQIDILNNR